MVSGREMSPNPHPAELLGARELPAGTVTLMALTAPDHLDPLELGEGLGAYCPFRPEDTLAMLRQVLQAPGGRVTAAVAGRRLVGYLALFHPGPQERWGRAPIPGLFEIGALEVDRMWRRKGLARALLQTVFAGGELDQAILIAPQYAEHWDLEASGLSLPDYRHLILRLFRRHGFAEFATDDPLIAANPRNFLLARVGPGAPPSLYLAFSARLTLAPPRASRAETDRRQHYFGDGLTTIRHINQLPEEERAAIYRRLIPPRVIELLGLDPATGRDRRGNRLVTYVCPPDQGFVRIEARRHPEDPDCAYLLKLTQPTETSVEIAFIIASDPEAERFNVDHDAGGHRVGILAGVRNPGEELRAMRAGLAPGQVRRGLRLFRQVLPLVESFAGELGKEQISIEALCYHHAFLYERHGFRYVTSTARDRMEALHRQFQPGGEFHRRLDASTPFRMPDAAGTVRGRSWAIHDGILGEHWPIPRLYRVVGRDLASPTSWGCPY